MNAQMVHSWGIDESGNTLMRQIVIPDGDQEMVLSTNWSKTTISLVFRQNIQKPRRSVHALDVAPDLVQIVRTFLQAQDALNGCLEHFNSLLLTE